MSNCPPTFDFESAWSVCTTTVATALSVQNRNLCWHSLRTCVVRPKSVWRWDGSVFGEGYLVIFFPFCPVFFSLVCVHYNLVHCFLHLPSCPLCLPAALPLQLKHLPSRKRRGLASVWSAKTEPVCIRLLCSWANSSAAALWAKPGALTVTNAPLQEQVRPPATSNTQPDSEPPNGR